MKNRYLLILESLTVVILSGCLEDWYLLICYSFYINAIHCSVLRNIKLGICCISTRSV